MPRTSDVFLAALAAALVVLAIAALWALSGATRLADALGPVR